MKIAVSCLVALVGLSAMADGNQTSAIVTMTDVSSVRGKAFVEEHFSVANFKKSVEAFMNGSLSEHSSDIKSGSGIKSGVGVKPGES